MNPVRCHPSSIATLALAATIGLSAISCSAQAGTPMESPDTEAAAKALARGFETAGGAQRMRARSHDSGPATIASPARQPNVTAGARRLLDAQKLDATATPPEAALPGYTHDR